MSINFSIPWHKYACIAELARRLEGVSPQFGKTALQKMVFLLQEIYGVPLGYRFTLYNYGPYSHELATDLDLAEGIDAVKLVPDEDTGGYHIRPGSNNLSIRKRGKDFLDQHQDTIDKLINELGRLRARDLELYTTILFVVKNLRHKPSTKDVQDIVEKMKPYFTASEIRSAIRFLELKRFIQLSR